MNHYFKIDEHTKNDYLGGILYLDPKANMDLIMGSKSFPLSEILYSTCGGIVLYTCRFINLSASSSRNDCVSILSVTFQRYRLKWLYRTIPSLKSCQRMSIFHFPPIVSIVRITGQVNSRFSILNKKSFGFLSFHLSITIFYVSILLFCKYLYYSNY